MKQLTLGSLFDGIGGFCYAAGIPSGIDTGCTIKPLWAAEVEPNCIDITRYRFKDVMHVGSVTELKGDEIQPVDIITFGSPCQDLSIAGKRKGLKGNRSGLFIHAIRIIREMGYLPLRYYSVLRLMFRLYRSPCIRGVGMLRKIHCEYLPL